MATFQITGPDGAVYHVSGDDAEGAMAALQQHLGQQAAPAPKDIGNQHVDAGSVFSDEALFGLPGKAAAGLNALAQAGIAALPGESPWEGKTVGELYDTNRNQYQNAREQYAEDHPVANTAASIGGSLYGGTVTGAAAGNLLGRAAPRLANFLQSSYAGRMAGEAASGSAQGALSAYGHDQDVGIGALIGAAAGGLSRPLIDAGGSVLSSIGGLVGVGNQRRASNAIAQALARGGVTSDDIANELAGAAAAGQPYNVADAIGNAGQRMLTGIVRSPGDMRQTIAETLQNRQAGQGERLVNALSEGFAAPNTAAQTRAAMTEARNAAADRSYEAARTGAGVVDPTTAIQRANDFLQPGASSVMNPGNNIADDSIEAAVRRARSYLTDGNSVLTDFNAALRSKRELDSMIEKANPSIQRQLIPIRNALDDSLAVASDPYAAARDQFRRDSQAIDAIDQGTAATSSRTRAADNIDAFNALPSEEAQQGFRVGYADPLIAKVENASMSPGTNKARPLITGKTEQEFPAFAAPGQADLMGDRIAREHRMFQTTNTALGGSQTADNLADIADVQGFDPTMLTAYATGGWKGAALHGLTRGINAIQGNNQATRDLIARSLLETDPQAARLALEQATAQGQRRAQINNQVIRALISGASTEIPRMQANQ